MGKHEGNQYSNKKLEGGQIVPLPKTADSLAKEYGVSKNTIQRDAKFAEEVENTPDQRNTPTNVGKTWQVGPNLGPTWKHPHERGEDFTQMAQEDGEVETPPRTWGRRLV